MAASRISVAPPKAPSAGAIGVAAPAPGSAPSNHSAAATPVPGAGSVAVAPRATSAPPARATAVSALTAGPARSTTTVADATGPQLPRASRARMAMTCEPGLSDAPSIVAASASEASSNAPSAAVIGVPFPAPGSLPMNHSAAAVVDAASAAVAPSVTGPDATGLGEAEAPEATGPERSIDTATLATSLQLPAVSRTRTPIVCTPGASAEASRVVARSSAVWSKAPSAALIGVPWPAPGSVPSNHSAPASDAPELVAEALRPTAPPATRPGVAASDVTTGGVVAGGGGGSTSRRVPTSRRPWPKLLSGPAAPRSRAVRSSSASCWSAESPGRALSSSARAPATCGAAREVPELVV